MPSNEENPAFVRADAGVRGRAVVVGIAGIIIGYVALSYCQAYLADLRALADINAPVAVERLGALFRIAVLTLLGSLCAFALLLALLARRVLTDNRFPPRGLKVIVDTRLVTGEAARTKAEEALVLAGTLIAIAFCLMLWGWRTIRVLESGLV